MEERTVEADADPPVFVFHKNILESLQTLTNGGARGSILYSAMLSTFKSVGIKYFSADNITLLVPNFAYVHLDARVSDGANVFLDGRQIAFECAHSAVFENTTEDVLGDPTKAAEIPKGAPETGTKEAIKDATLLYDILNGMIDVHKTFETSKDSESKVVKKKMGEAMLATLKEAVGKADKIKVSVPNPPLSVVLGFIFAVINTHALYGRTHNYPRTLFWLIDQSIGDDPLEKKIELAASPDPENTDRVVLFLFRANELRSVVFLTRFSVAGFVSAVVVTDSPDTDDAGYLRAACARAFKIADGELAISSTRFSSDKFFGFSLARTLPLLLFLFNKPTHPEEIDAVERIVRYFESDLTACKEATPDENYIKTVSVHRYVNVFTTVCIVCNVVPFLLPVHVFTPSDPVRAVEATPEPRYGYGVMRYSGVVKKAVCDAWFHRRHHRDAAQTTTTGRRLGKPVVNDVEDALTVLSNAVNVGVLTHEDMENLRLISEAIARLRAREAFQFEGGGDLAADLAVDDGELDGDHPAIPARESVLELEGDRSGSDEEEENGESSGVSWSLSTIHYGGEENKDWLEWGQSSGEE